MNALTVIPQASFSMSDMERMAIAISKGGLFGSKDPNAVLTLCLLAQAEGKHPAIIMQDFHVINGKPAKKADAMLRDFINSGGKVKWHTLTDDCADATFTHPSGEARIDWTLKRAQAAGIANPMWKKYPRQMLRSRVISEGVRTVFPGATSGLYEVGEVQDIAVERGEVVDEVAAPIVEHEAEPKRAAPVKLEGPYTSKSALWAAVRSFDREVRSCGDLDTLEGLLSTDDSKALMAQIERDAPLLAHGGDGLPDEFEPLHALIAKSRTDLAAANENTDWQSNVLAAG